MERRFKIVFDGDQITLLDEGIVYDVFASTDDLASELRVWKEKSAREAADLLSKAEEFQTEIAELEKIERALADHLKQRMAPRSEQ